MGVTSRSYMQKLKPCPVDSGIDCSGIKRCSRRRRSVWHGRRNRHRDRWFLGLKISTHGLPTLNWFDGMDRRKLALWARDEGGSRRPDSNVRILL